MSGRWARGSPDPAALGERYGASAHNFTPVRSIYTWQGQIHELTEGRVSLHTRRERVADIVARAEREHPYQVPGVSARPIIDGNPDYLAWIAAQTDAAIPA
jgi:periplasmic divalent cation tolerance protein